MSLRQREEAIAVNCWVASAILGASVFNSIRLSRAERGGAVVTSDAELFQRVVMYHDVIGGLRSGVPKERMLNGLNFRMSELHGAIMLVQLGRLTGLLTDMRQHKTTL